MSGYIHPDYPRPATIGPWPGAVPPLVHGPGGVGTTDTAIGRGGAPGRQGLVDMESGVPGAGEKADTVTGERTKTRMGPGRGGGSNDWQCSRSIAGE